MEYRVALVERLNVLPGIVAFRFERPEGLSYVAGQYFTLDLGGGLMKPFSFSSSPTEFGFFEFTTRISNSEFKKRLDLLEVGGKVWVSGPFGSFTASGCRKLALLAGGIGITPFMSILRFLASEQMECEIVLLYGSNRRDSIIYSGELGELSSLIHGFKVVHVLAEEKNNSPGCYGGVICEEIIREEVGDSPAWVYMVCGPQAMVSAMKDVLEGMGVPEQQVILEKFT